MLFGLGFKRKQIFLQKWTNMLATSENLFAEFRINAQKLILRKLAPIVRNSEHCTAQDLCGILVKFNSSKKKKEKGKQTYWKCFLFRKIAEFARNFSCVKKGKKAEFARNLFSYFAENTVFRIKQQLADFSKL